LRLGGFATSISDQIFIVDSMLGGIVVESSVRKQVIATVTTSAFGR
jgi:hypothetical protein